MEDRLSESRPEQVYEIIPEQLLKSNLLINAKFKSSLNCHKLLFLQLYKIQLGHYRELPSGELEVITPASEIIKFLSVRSGTIYRSLESIALSMVNTTVGYSDPVSRQFEYMALITDAKYEKGIFYTTFNSRAKKVLLDISKDYTTLTRGIMMSWSSVYSYRLYELFKQRCYYPKNFKGVRNGIFVLEFDIYELRLLLGVVNSNLESVQKILAATNPPDYKKACEASPEKMYLSYTSFRRDLLEPAIKEINNNPISDMTVGLLTPDKKSHGEVYNVRFEVIMETLNEEKEKEIVPVSLTDEEKFVFLLEVSSLFGDAEVQYQDVVAISEAAGYNKQLIEEKVELSRSANITTNYVGWLISAIKGDYKKSGISPAKSQNNANSGMMTEPDELASAAIDVLEGRMTKEEYDNLLKELQT